MAVMDRASVYVDLSQKILERGSSGSLVLNGNGLVITIEGSASDPGGLRQLDRAAADDFGNAHVLGPGQLSEESFRPWVGVEHTTSGPTVPTFSFKSGESPTTKNAGISKKGIGKDLQRPCLEDEPSEMETSNLHDVLVVSEEGLGHHVPRNVIHSLPHQGEESATSKPKTKGWKRSARAQGQ